MPTKFPTKKPRNTKIVVRMRKADAYADPKTNIANKDGG